MRIAYLAPYQGAALKQRRPIVANLSLAGTSKMEVIARLLHRRGHEVEILSQGEVVELKLKYYPAFREPKPFHDQIPVFYSSTVPVRFINGLWQGMRLLSLFKARHKVKPFDAVIFYDLKVPQIMCANYAIKRMGLPVIAEYEDDAFVDIVGKPDRDSHHGYHRRVRDLFSRVSGGMACSPHLLSQIPDGIPKLLIRGVVGEDAIRASERPHSEKKNWVLFSGTHFWTKGIGPLIEAWPKAALAGWELHITGHGQETAALKKLAAGQPGIIFHGVVSTPELAQLMSTAKICINPHELSQTPGNVFAFKIIEYLAAGTHVISTPMGFLEPEIEKGITYIPDNRPDTIVHALNEVVATEKWRQTATQAVHNIYGPEALGETLENLIRQSAK
jgi:glycosyltransferase involved in cell wall biosynthesis